MKIIAFLLLFPLVCWAKSPNFILILSDDQSWKGSSVLMDDRYKNSKSDYYQTPNLEALFARGMRFSNGYAPAPYCCPTRRSIQIGQSPARHIYQKDQERWTEYYKKQINIPQALKSINPNYRAAHFGKWDHRFDEVPPESVGYDLSDGATGNGEGGSRDTGGPASKEDPKLIDHITQRSIKFIKDCKKNGNPFYLQISHYAVHLDIYYKQSTLDKVKQREKGILHHYPEFAAMTEDMDHSIGILMKELERLVLDDTTYIIFLSDNGGRSDLPDYKSDNLNSPLREGKGKMYEGGLRVPFTISGPGITPGSSSRVSVSGVDLLPTMTDFAGQKLLHERLDGGSLKKLLLGKSNSVSRNNDFLCFHHSLKRKPQTAILQNNYKLVKTWQENKVELFDLNKDLSETDNLAEKMPDKVEELLILMNSYLESNKTSTEYSPEVKKKKGKTKKGKNS